MLICSVPALYVSRIADPLWTLSGEGQPGIGEESYTRDFYYDPAAKESVKLTRQRDVVDKIDFSAVYELSAYSYDHNGVDKGDLRSYHRAALVSRHQNGPRETAYRFYYSILHGHDHHVRRDFKQNRAARRSNGRKLVDLFSAFKEVRSYDEKMTTSALLLGVRQKAYGAIPLCDGELAESAYRYLAANLQQVWIDSALTQLSTKWAIDAGTLLHPFATDGPLDCEALGNQGR